jgi:hypothetical protein
MMLLSYLAWFFAGVFLTNAVPHSVAGLQGRVFQSPFAKPPGVGLSSPRTNIIWGAINLVAGWALLTQIGAFDIRYCIDAAALFAGILAMGLVISGYFSRFYGGND